MIFETRALFREWLGANGETAEGVWLEFGKTAALKTLSANDALEEALCFGWIDGQLQSIDKDRYKKYFARRRPNSMWSDKNRALVVRLTERGLMMPEGLKAVEYAKKNGQWDASKCHTVSPEQIQEFLRMVEPFQPAYTHLLAMSPSVQRTYTGFYFEAKSEPTRQKRLEKIVDRLNNNLKPM